MPLEASIVLSQVKMRGFVEKKNLHTVVDRGEKPMIFINSGTISILRPLFPKKLGQRKGELPIQGGHRVACRGLMERKRWGIFGIIMDAKWIGTV